MNFCYSRIILFVCHLWVRKFERKYKWYLYPCVGAFQKNVFSQPQFIIVFAFLCLFFHKWIIKKKIQVICKGPRHFLNLFSACKKVIIIYLFFWICVFANCFEWNGVEYLWGKSESVFLTHSQLLLHFISLLCFL